MTKMVSPNTGNELAEVAGRMTSQIAQSLPDATLSPGSSRFSKWRRLGGRANLVPRVFSLFKMTLAHSRSRVSNEDGDVQPRPQGLLAFQYGRLGLLPSRRHFEKREDPGDEVGEDPGDVDPGTFPGTFPGTCTQQITCLQRGWRCIQNGGYGEKGEKNWVRDAKVKINKMAEKAEVQFKKK